jgi:glycosyltransferase involved in cell wall biosynthesis
MTSITALLHTHNDALRLGRALETLYACDDILVVDHGSRDATVRIAGQYGARVVEARAGASPEDYLRSPGRGFASLPSVSAGAASPSSESPESARARWILCLDPRESLTEKLSATLFEWKSEALHIHAPAVRAFSVFLREETAQGWMEHPAAQTRLVPQTWNLWNGAFPVNEPSAVALKGELLRFAFP